MRMFLNCFAAFVLVLACFPHSVFAQTGDQLDDILDRLGVATDGNGNDDDIQPTEIGSANAQDVAAQRSEIVSGYANEVATRDVTNDSPFSRDELNARLEAEGLLPASSSEVAIAREQAQSIIITTTTLEAVRAGEEVNTAATDDRLITLGLDPLDSSDLDAIGNLSTGDVSTVIAALEDSGVDSDLIAALAEGGLTRAEVETILGDAGVETTDANIDAVHQATRDSEVDGRQLANTLETIGIVNSQGADGVESLVDVFDSDASTLDRVESAFNAACSFIGLFCSNGGGGALAGGPAGGGFFGLSGAERVARVSAEDFVSGDRLENAYSGSAFGDFSDQFSAVLAPVRPGDGSLPEHALASQGASITASRLPVGHSASKSDIAAFWSPERIVGGANAAQGRDSYLQQAEGPLAVAQLALAAVDDNLGAQLNSNTLVTQQRAALEMARATRDGVATLANPNDGLVIQDNEEKIRNCMADEAGNAWSRVRLDYGACAETCGPPVARGEGRETFCVCCAPEMRAINRGSADGLTEDGCRSVVDSFFLGGCGEGGTAEVEQLEQEAQEFRDLYGDTQLCETEDGGFSTERRLPQETVNSVLDQMVGGEGGGAAEGSEGAEICASLQRLIQLVDTNSDGAQAERLEHFQVFSRTGVNLNIGDVSSLVDYVGVPRPISDGFSIESSPRLQRIVRYMCQAGAVAYFKQAHATVQSYVSRQNNYNQCLDASSRREIDRMMASMEGEMARAEQATRASNPLEDIINTANTADARQAAANLSAVASTIKRAGQSRQTGGSGSFGAIGN